MEKKIKIVIPQSEIRKVRAGKGLERLMIQKDKKKEQNKNSCRKFKSDNND